jgi:drug/metabolite transporter (DMT)-like permease
MNIGVLFAIGAMLGWGFGDFLIEKSVRKMGNSVSLFFITAIGSILLLPFVWNDVTMLLSSQLGSKEFWVLIGAGMFALIASLFDFEALRVGKISVVEPVYAIEIVLTVLVTGVVLDEWLTPTQTILVLAVIASILLVSVKSFSHLKKFRIERGVMFALVAALLMAGEIFFTGFGARLTSPLTVNWMSNTIIALVMVLYLARTKQLRSIIPKFRANTSLVARVSLIDNLAWISFAYSAIYIPIGLAVAISEAYIALAALLGLVINKEKLRPHQFAGVGITIVAVIALSYVS